MRSAKRAERCENRASESIALVPRTCLRQHNLDQVPRVISGGERNPTRYRHP